MNETDKALAEEWKPVSGYEGLYEISSLGNVRGIKRGKILKQCYSSMGYTHVGLSKNSNQKTNTTHRLVAKEFVHNPENKPCINHIDGIKDNNRAINLEWCTQKENINHAFELGLMGVGGNANGSILIEIQVREIREKAKRMSHRELARMYGVHHSTISQIVHRRTWVHI